MRAAAQSLRLHGVVTGSSETRVTDGLGDIHRERAEKRGGCTGGETEGSGNLVHARQFCDQVDLADIAPLFPCLYAALGAISTYLQVVGAVQ
ncbi:MAG: hypothetical protein ACFBRM_03835 [Pikeienuella sp.]